MTLFMKKNSDTEVMTVLCFEYEHQLVNLWRGREADISRYRKKGQVYHYSHFEDNGFWEINSKQINEKTDFDEETFTALVEYYLLLKQSYEDEVWDLYSKYLVHMFERNIREQKGILCLLQICDKTGKTQAESRICYLMESYRYDSEMKSVQIQILDMFGDELWMDLSYSRVNV